MLVNQHNDLTKAEMDVLVTLRLGWRPEPKPGVVFTGDPFSLIEHNSAGIETGTIFAHYWAAPGETKFRYYTIVRYSLDLSTAWSLHRAAPAGVTLFDMRWLHEPPSRVADELVRAFLDWTVPVTGLEFAVVSRRVVQMRSTVDAAPGNEGGAR